MLILILLAFEPPHHAEGMKAMLEHSVQTYGPLPSELRPHRMRSRKDSRPSPYPHSRPSKTPTPPETTYSPPTFHKIPPRSTATPVLQQAPLINTNLPTAAPVLGSIKPLSPFQLKQLNVEDSNKSGPQKNIHGTVRPRVGSNARRTALGWTKRSTGPKGSTEPVSVIGGKLSKGANTTSTDQKENVIGMGSITT